MYDDGLDDLMARPEPPRKKPGQRDAPVEIIMFARDRSKTSAEFDQAVAQSPVGNDRRTIPPIIFTDGGYNES